MTNAYFEEKFFVLKEIYFYEDPEDMAHFGELVAKFAKRMYDPEDSSLTVTHDHHKCVQITSRLTRPELYALTRLKSRNLPWQRR